MSIGEIKMGGEEIEKGDYVDAREKKEPKELEDLLAASLIGQEEEVWLQDKHRDEKKKEN